MRFPRGSCEPVGSCSVVSHWTDHNRQMRRGCDANSGELLAFGVVRKQNSKLVRWCVCIVLYCVFAPFGRLTACLLRCSDLGTACIPRWSRSDAVPCRLACAH